MKAVTALEMQEIDRIAIRERGMPAAVLMGLAGKAVADRIVERCPWAGSAAVFAGTGNNGGDGFVAAYYLANAGIRADVFLAGTADKISETARTYHDLCKNSGITITGMADAGDIDLDRYDCVVDALLGTGSSGQARGAAAGAIRLINDSDAYVVSVDIPSGLGSDGAAPEGEAVVADMTVTIGLPKLSLVTYPGKEFAGDLHVADIGFPRALTESASLANELIDDDFFAWHSIREIESDYRSRPDTHKGERGHLLIIGGFDGMEGAALLAAGAAFETGVGLATLMTTDSARAVVAGKIPELMTLSLPWTDGTGKDGPADALDALLGSGNYDALVIGPGMGRTVPARAVFEAAITSAGRHGIRRVLIDGDGLFHLAACLEGGGAVTGADMVVTPHFMEASRLLGVPVDEIRKNRLHAAGSLAGRLGCAALLKGPATIVSDAARSFINTTGSASLAAAGSGDVLSGIIGALLLRRFTPLVAASYGAHIHGRAADLCRAERDTDLLRSSDLLPYISRAMQ